MKRAKGSLRDSEERMSLAAEAANLGIWVWDVQKMGVVSVAELVRLAQKAGVAPAPHGPKVP
jgi:PAS domain-containing protein